MAIITDPKEAHFLFIVDTDASINERKFDVVEFFGEEAISKLYQFNITLASEDQNISFSDVVHQPATFYLKVNDVQGDIVTSKREIPGIVSDLQYIGMDGPGRYHYEATFVPHHWYLNLYYQSRVFQNNTITQIIQEVLKGAEVGHDTYSKFSSDKANNSVRDYCVQYCETDLDFIHRIKEFEGIYYYFEQGTEKMTFIDSSVNEPNILDPLSIYFEDGSGIDMDQMDAIDDLVYRERAIPEKVVLKDYHYEFPKDSMEADEALDKPRGLYYDHGQTLKDTPVPKVKGKSEKELRDEAKKNKQTRLKELAEIRKEEIECRRRILTGRSNCVELTSGYRIELNEAKDDTLRTDLKDKTFLITQVKHVGTQAMLIHGSPSRLLAEHGYPETTAGYFNTFTSIPGDVQYRPPRVTPEPKIPGIMTAKVESAGKDKDKADIDEQGRYVVRMPFDRRETDTTKPGTATRVLRMAQPYSGKHYGIHFPNHKDTEMVFAFINLRPARAGRECQINHTNMPMEFEPYRI